MEQAVGTKNVALKNIKVSEKDKKRKQYIFNI